MWLDFEGSFRETSVWINGALAATHDCGYTPFRLRLDNITSVKFGDKTTIAVFVDPALCNPRGIQTDGGFVDIETARDLRQLPQVGPEDERNENAETDEKKESLPAISKHPHRG